MHLTTSDHSSFASPPRRNTTVSDMDFAFTDRIMSHTKHIDASLLTTDSHGLASDRTDAFTRGSRAG